MRAFAILFLGIVMAACSAAAEIPEGAVSPVGAIPTGKVAPPATQALGLLDCTGAIEVSLNNTYNGDNSGLWSNVSGYGCGYWYEPGGEVVFHLYLAQPTMFEATVEGSTCDVDLAVLDQCDENAGCIVLVDATAVTETPVSGDIYFVVDGYSEEGCPFTLTLTELPPPPPATFCDLAVPLTETSFYGYTCTDGVNLVNSLACSPYPEEGLEAYYEITMEPGSTITASVLSASNCALWLLGNCTEPYTCLAFVDEGLGGDGDPEVLTYTNNGTESIVVYLVIDFWGQDACGTYEVEYTYTPGEVSVKPTNWGEIKELFKE